MAADSQFVIGVWQWIASGLLAVLGWVWGRKDGKEGMADLSRRVEALERVNLYRAEHPEQHPLANLINERYAEIDRRLLTLEIRNERE